MSKSDKRRASTTVVIIIAAVIALWFKFHFESKFSFDGGGEITPGIYRTTPKPKGLPKLPSGRECPGKKKSR